MGWGIAHLPQGSSGLVKPLYGLVALAQVLPAQIEVAVTVSRGGRFKLGRRLRGLSRVLGFGLPGV